MNRKWNFYWLTTNKNKLQTIDHQHPYSYMKKLTEMDYCQQQMGSEARWNEWEEGEKADCRSRLILTYWMNLLQYVTPISNNGTTGLASSVPLMKCMSRDETKQPVLHTDGTAIPIPSSKLVRFDETLRLHNELLQMVTMSLSTYSTHIWISFMTTSGLPMAAIFRWHTCVSCDGWISEIVSIMSQTRDRVGNMG